MKTEENKRDAMRFFDEVLNAGDMSVIDEIIHDDLVDHEEIPGIRRRRPAYRCGST